MVQGGVRSAAAIAAGEQSHQRCSVLGDPALPRPAPRRGQWKPGRVLGSGTGLRMEPCPLPVWQEGDRDAEEDGVGRKCWDTPTPLGLLGWVAGEGSCL